MMKRWISLLLCLLLILAAVPAAYAEGGEFETPEVELSESPTVKLSGSLVIVAKDMDNEAEQVFEVGTLEDYTVSLDLFTDLMALSELLEEKAMLAGEWLTDKRGLDPETFRMKNMEIIPGTLVVRLNGTQLAQEDIAAMQELAASDLVELYADCQVTILGGVKANPCYAMIDVDKDAWYYEDVAYAVENGLMLGDAEDTFSPDKPLTRAMLVTILYRQAGEPEVDAVAAFDDVIEGVWYADAVAWAAENGIVNGYDDGLFHPGDALTREQFATILYRYADMLGVVDEEAIYDDLDDYYEDADQISDWARTAMVWANNNRLINGVDYSLLAPAGSATRAQGAAILHRFNDSFGTSEDISGLLAPILFA